MSPTKQDLNQASQAWWDSIKTDPEKVNHWLKRQYQGEVSAASKIRELILCYPADANWQKVVEMIVNQEVDHAKWIADLLRARGIEPVAEGDNERYWREPLNAITDWNSGCAVAAHAEEMRLARIQAICGDSTAPADILEVFQKILVQERFHAKAFRSFTTNEAYAATLASHEAGMNALGLLP